MLEHLSFYSNAADGGRWFCFILKHPLQGSFPQSEPRQVQLLAIAGPGFMQ